MGFFFTSYKPLKAIKEAEIDGQQGGEEQTPDYTAEDQASEQPPADDAATANDTQGEEQAPTEGEGQEGGEEQPVDYTQMDADQEGEQQAQDVPPEDGGGDQGGATQADPQQPSEVDELKQQEEDIYENLTPEQLDIKHKELKNRYLEMFDTTTSIIDRIGDVSVIEENLEIIKYVSNTLSSLRDMLTDYINSVYKTKSYIENLVNYNKFLAVLNGINQILEEMNKKGE